ncbi:MAG: PLP-dependent aminotransferase family protein [Chitinophagaceae bacterium]|nr:PLP-dependent aminotransferase family protein [Chitinophagaceae bacterium]
MGTVLKRNGSLLYLRIAQTIEQQIAIEVRQVGDKLPSIRTLCREYGVSPSTALQAYHHLESKALISARPQSGYYVCQPQRQRHSIHRTSAPDLAKPAEDINALVTKVYSNLEKNSKQIPFSLGLPALELLPVAKLNKGLIQAMRELDGGGIELESPLGNERLRKQIARWSFPMEAQIDHRNIITTAGCLSAISHCLMALTQAGDTIAMESPISFGMLQVAQNLRLKVLELPTNPLTGIELDAVKKALSQKKIRLCLFIPNFSNPLGTCMPDENKKALVELLEKYNIPLIENDLNGDVYFGTHRPKSCKTYDESGLVLWCGSVSKSLAPGYRVGWVEPGKFGEKVQQVKMYHSISSTTITQEVIASFLENSRYETHLRKLRHTLYTNYLQYIRTINGWFPEDTRVSQPKGGFVLWVELNKKINTVELYENAIRQKISIAPGKIFTLTNQFNNCMRLNYGLVWNEKTETGLRVLGKLIKTML